MTEIPNNYIKKIGFYMSDDLEYAALVDSENGKPKLFFPGRGFIRSIVELLNMLYEEFGQEKIIKFLTGEKLQK